MPLWLYEGLLDYISSKVLAAEHLQRFDVFSNSNQVNADSLFIKEIAPSKGKYIISFIGNKGIMPALFSNDRMQYAPAFYHGSESFVKYLAEHYGVKILLAAISSFQTEQETIEKLTGKRIAGLKKKWMHTLNISE